MINLKLLRIIFIITIIITSKLSYSQIELSSTEALNKFTELHNTIEKSFPQNEIKTFRRESFSEEELKTYLSQHFQQLDLIPSIEGNHKLKLNTYLHSANWFRLMGLLKESINSYKAFFNYYETHEQNLNEDEKNEYLKMRTFGYDMLADNYAKISYLDSADLQHKFNIKFAKHFNRISYPSSINNYGLFFYWTKKDLTTALTHFKKAFEITKRKFPKHYLLGSIRDNIADIYFEQDKIAEANKLYNENFRFYKETINEDIKSLDTTRLISAGCQYAITTLNLNKINLAEEILNELESIIIDPFNREDIQPNSILEVLKVKELLYFKQNKFQDSYKASQNVKKLSDSLNALTLATNQKWLTVVNSIVLEQVKLNFTMERIQKENKIKSQSLKLWVVTLISLIVVIILVSLFLRKRQNLIITKNKQLLTEQSLEFSALKNAQLNLEIKSKQRDLSDFAINLTQNQEWAKILADKLKQLKSTTGRERKMLLDDLEQVIHNKIKFDDHTEDFYERLDKLSDSFYSILHNKYPNFTKTDIRLCSLIRLKIDSHAIANLQNITLPSLNTSRYRLRKKLNLKEEDNLDEFIQFL